MRRTTALNLQERCLMTIPRRRPIDADARRDLLLVLEENAMGGDIPV